MGKPRIQPNVFIYALIALAVLWGGAHVVKWARPAFARHHLKRLVGRIEPWTTSTNYTARGWTRLVEAAKACQKAEPKLVGQTLGQYLDGFATKPEQLAVARGQVVLLLRTEFELPEKFAAGERLSFVTWARPDANLNTDGTANLSWPLAWNEGKPQLLAGNDGLNVGNCSLPEEYVYLRYRYPYRAMANYHPSAR